MYCSQEPIVVVDAPEAIFNLATRDSRVIINKRPDQWPQEVRERFKNDKRWRKCIGPYDGLLMSPELTDFMLDIRQKTPLAILCQGERGEIYVQAGTFIDIRTHGGSPLHYGVNAAIRLKEWNHRPFDIGNTWGSTILAIARLAQLERPQMCYDPFGEIFTSLLKQ